MMRLSRLVCVSLFAAGVLTACSAPMPGADATADAGSIRDVSNPIDALAMDTAMPTDANPPTGTDASTPTDTPVPADVPAGAPIAVFVPTPPAYWYVDTLPLRTMVGGANVTHYRARVDGGAWSAEQPVSTPLEFATLAAGRRTLEIIGRNAAGAWQATPTQAQPYVATQREAPTACTLKTAGGTCDVILEPSTTKRYFVGTGVTAMGFETRLNFGAGGKICLRTGTHRNANFRGLVGSESQPITIVNCGGPVLFQAQAADYGNVVGIETSKFVRMVGIGSSDMYGIAVASGATPTDSTNAVEMHNGSSDFEMAYVEIRNASYAGLAARTNVSCTYNRSNFVQNNTFLHHNYVHDTHGEGMYLGGSHWNAARLPTPPNGGTVDCGSPAVRQYEAELHGVRLYRNRFENIWADGLQAGSAYENAEIYENNLTNCGQEVGGYTSAAFTINPGTRGKVYRNYVKNTHFGVSLAAPGGLDFFDNIIENCDTTGLSGQPQVADPGEGIHIVNNTMNGCGNECIQFYMEIPTMRSGGNVAYNNIMIGFTNPNGAVISNNSAFMRANNVTTGTAATHFVDAANGNYQLRAGSPAINAGRDVSQYGVSFDYANLPRPVGAYDVGAYEFRP